MKMKSKTAAYIVRSIAAAALLLAAQRQEATIARQQKQIEALTMGLQK
jgi:geranylgeranyl pyrophosphate synthase